MNRKCNTFLEGGTELFWVYSCWIRALNVNFSIFCTFLYQTSLSLIYPTISARRLLFVWCSLSDNRQTIVICLSVVPPDIWQHLTDEYHTYTRHVSYADQTYTVPDVHRTSTIYDKCQAKIDLFEVYKIGIFSSSNSDQFSVWWDKKLFLGVWYHSYFWLITHQNWWKPM